MCILCVFCPLSLEIIQLWDTLTYCIRKLVLKTNWDFRYDLKLFCQIKNILDLKIGLAVIVVERGWERRGLRFKLRKIINVSLKVEVWELLMRL